MRGNDQGDVLIANIVDFSGGVAFPQSPASPGGLGGREIIPVDRQGVEDQFLRAGIVGNQTEFSIAQSRAYLGGPPPMIDAAIEVLRAAGMPEGQIFFDKFTDRSHVQSAA